MELGISNMNRSLGGEGGMGDIDGIAIWMGAVVVDMDIAVVKMGGRH